MNYTKILTSMLVAACAALPASTHTTSSDPVSRQGYSTITPSARVEVQGAGLSFNASFNYLEARESGLEFAKTGVFATPVAVADAEQGVQKAPSFRYEPSFSVQIGAELPHDDWNVEVNYTWLHQNTKVASIEGTATNGLVALLATAPSTAELTANAANSYKLRYNTGGVNLGRNYFVSQNLTMRPFTGVAAAFIETTNNTDYSFVATIGTPAATDADYNVSQRQKMWGVGLSTGLNTVWLFDSNWGVYGKSSVTNLWTGTTARNVTTIVTDPAGAATVTIAESYQAKAQNIVLVTDVEAGVTYSMNFDEDFAIAINLGWKQNAFNNFNQNTVAGGNLSVQGLVLEAKFDF